MYNAKMTRGRDLFALLPGCFFLFFFGSSVLASTSEIEAIRQQIQNSGARWVAAETSITRLPVERRLKRVGLVKRALSVPESAAPQSTLPVTPPGATYLNYLDYSFVTPIKDQGDCGDCWAFATTAALESQVLIGTGGAGAPGLDLSEQTLLSCCGARVCGDCKGGYIDSASDFIQSTGLPVQSCFPYYDYAAKYQTPPACSQAACPYWQSSTDAIKGWRWVALTSPSVGGLKTALASYGPLVTTMNVHNDFYSYSGGIYSYVGGQGNTFQGGHAVEIIGYDDTNQCFIVKNSWGAGWGEGGFFRIAYSEVYDQKYVQFGYFTIAYVGSKPVQSTCSPSIFPKSKTITYSGGNAQESVTSQSGCTWTAVSNAAWIKVVSGASGAANGTVKYYVYPNNTHIRRTGALTIAGQTLTVTQTGKPLNWLW